MRSGAGQERQEGGEAALHEAPVTPGQVERRWEWSRLLICLFVSY